MEINYKFLINKIKETIDNDFDCTILMFFAGEIIYSDLEDDLPDDFYPLILYFNTFACYDSVNFKNTLIFLYNISKSRDIDSFDINYILNLNELNRLFLKHKQGYISNSYITNKIKEYFFTEDILNIISLFQTRLNISIDLSNTKTTPL